MMRRAPAGPRRSTAGLILEVLWLLVGVLAMSQGGLGAVGTSTQHPSARSSYQLLTAFGFVALGASATHAMRGRAFLIVGSVAGGVLTLYGLALILLGHEDVGGLRAALPFGAGAVALGLWTVAEVRNRARERRVNVA
jgi:hypothetical protein